MAGAAGGEAPRRLYHRGQNVPLNRRIARLLRLDVARGVLVQSVKPDSPAQQAGVREHDAIVALGGRWITSNDALHRALKLALGPAATNRARPEHQFAPWSARHVERWGAPAGAIQSATPCPT